MRGLSWFWSDSLVNPHASHTRCLTGKRALALTSGVLEASSGCRWVNHKQGRFRGGGGYTIQCFSASGSLQPHSPIPFGFSPSWRIQTVVTCRRDPEQTPRRRLGRSRKSFQSTHTYATEIKKRGRAQSGLERRSLHGNKQTWLPK